MKAKKIFQAMLQIGFLEWLIAFHLLAYLILLFTSSSQKTFSYSLGIWIVLLTMLLSAVVYRRILFANRFFRILHHIIVAAAVLVPYFWLQKMIPLINSQIYDAELQAIDLWLFGGDASIWLEGFTSTFGCVFLGIVYYSYYYILGLFVLYFLVRIPYS